MTRACAIARCVWLELLRRKDVYVLLILLGAMLVTLVSLDIFGLGGMVRYVMDVGLLLSWFFGWVLAIHVTARELPQEETSGTIYPLLARPILRCELLLGKWLGAWSIVSVATLLFYALVAVVVRGMGGNMQLAAVAQGFILHCVVLGILAAVALAFSTRMNHDAAATLSFVTTGAIFLIVPRIPVLLTQQGGFAGGVLLAIYNLAPHFELFDMRKRIVHAYGPADWKICVLVILYGLLWTALILFIAWMAYRRKRFARGSACGL